MRRLTFAVAIKEALAQALRSDGRVICYGLGADDPRRIFGTTQSLAEEFGPLRVFDTPTSENAMTGIAIGAALNGIRPVVTHQRLDFFLLAMDQLVNNAAKWHYMFGGESSVPITIRLIIGRGWGQGPTHSQNLQAWFAHIPGLKVVMPATAADAKGLLLSSIFDEDPVLFLEHRWLHQTEGDVPLGDVRVPIGRGRLVREGTDATVVSMSYATVEALRAADFLAEQGISCDLIDLRTIKPLDWALVFRSVRKTGRLLALDTGPATGSVAAEIVARTAMTLWSSMKAAPRRLAMPDCPEPTSFGLTRRFYYGAAEIVEEVATLTQSRIPQGAVSPGMSELHDVPGPWFKGPF